MRTFVEQMQKDKMKEIKVDVHILIVNYLSFKPDLIINELKKFGIIKNSGREIRLNPFL